MMEDIDALIADLTGGDERRAEAAVERLAAGGAQVCELLCDRLAESEGAEPEAIDRRWWLLRALAEIPDARVPPLMIAALQDGDAGVRQCAALGLRKQPDPQAVPALIASLSDGDHLVAALAADALATIGAPAVPALLEVLGSGPQPVRLEAVRALALIGDKRSIPALYKLLDGDSALLEYWANEGLERMGVGMMFFKPFGS